MNYQRCYDLLIKKRRELPAFRGEIHHIIPKSWGGDDSKNNLVSLTCREHFIAHLLLSKIAVTPKQKSSMLFALRRMLPNQKKSSKQYEKLKNNWVIEQSKYMNEIIGQNGETRRQLVTRKSANTRKSTLDGELTLEEKRIRKISKKSTNIITWEHIDGRVFTGTAIELSRTFLVERIGPSRLIENLGTPEYHRGWRSVEGGKQLGKLASRYSTIRTWIHKNGSLFTGTSYELALHAKLYPSRLERFALLNRRCDGWKVSVSASSYIKLKLAEEPTVDSIAKDLDNI